MTINIVNSAVTIRERVDALAWDELRTRLDRQGFTISEPPLDADKVPSAGPPVRRRPVSLDDRHGPHRCGYGRYRCFDHPLPDTIATLRSAFYAHLAPIANDWHSYCAATTRRFRSEHEELLERCRAAGQEPSHASHPALRRG